MDHHHTESLVSLHRTWISSIFAYYCFATYAYSWIFAHDTFYLWLTPVADDIWSACP